MSTEREYILKLAAKWEQRTITPQEEAQLNAWYQQHQDDPVNLPADFVASEAVHERRIWQGVQEQIGMNGRRRALRLFGQGPRSAIAAIAAAICVVTMGVWLYYGTDWLDGKTTERSLLSKHKRKDHGVIAPGKNIATLTLADGKTIQLSEAKTGVIIDASKLSYSDGTSIGSPYRGAESAGKIKLLTVSTPRGGTYQVILSDGTKVWLNADSEISFPSQFNGKQRRIKLSGEGYFEVAHNQSKPFIVESAAQQVQVFGTSFNINSYADEGMTMTTLLEGSVEVSYLHENEPPAPVRLLPNQRSVLIKNKLSVQPADPEEALAWKKGDFIFNGEKIESVMRKISRWYNIEVEYNGEIPGGRLYGKVSRSKDITQVLRVLELTKTVHFKIEGRNVIVSK